jgi:hypothetical protein
MSPFLPVPWLTGANKQKNPLNPSKMISFFFVCLFPRCIVRQKMSHRFFNDTLFYSSYHISFDTDSYEQEHITQFNNLDIHKKRQKTQANINDLYKEKK